MTELFPSLRRKNFNIVLHAHTILMKIYHRLENLYAKWFACFRPKEPYYVRLVPFHGTSFRES